MNRKQISAGAEKVEKIAQGRSAAELPADENARRMQGEAANGGAAASSQKKARAKRKNETQKKAAAAEERRARQRIEAAKRREEKKEGREQAYETRKQRRAEAAEARKQRRAEAAADRKEAQKQRAARTAEERQHRRAARAERRIRRREEGGKDKRAPGFGGWLAAVISLSVAVLALGAIVTVGYFDLTESKAALTDGYRAGAYELSEHVENLDGSLAKARIAGGGYEMQKLLAEMLVESELAEADLEALPSDGHGTESLAAFFNRVSAFSSRMLHKLAAGGGLDERETDAIGQMYEMTEKIRAAMPSLIESAGQGTLEELTDPDGSFAQALRSLDEATREERPRPQPRETMLSSMETMTEEQAVERAGTWFADLRPSELRVTGKSQMRDLACYDLWFRTESGDEYFAQITEQGGMLALFEGYRACSQQNFDAARASEIAGAFLEKCGYSGMKAVWASEAGSECAVQFAYEQDGVIVYPDKIVVKVCTERGIVTGLEAGGFLRHHRERTFARPAVAQSTVEQNASARMELHEVRLAVIPVDGRETLTYEVSGEYGGRTYFAYVDARTGETCEIRVVSPTDRGEVLR